MVQVAIVGLPQAGKTTLFNALTGAHGEVGGHHGAESVAVGIVRVPDGRVERLAQMFHPKKTVPASLQVEEVKGVFAHLTGGASSGRAVAALREADAMLMVLRGFESPYVPEIFGGVDPLREYDAMCDELLLADMGVVENRLASIEHDLARASAAEREALEKERDLLERCRQAGDAEWGLQTLEMTEHERGMLSGYAFLTLKPRLCVLNVDEEKLGDPAALEGLEGLRPAPVPICAELEMELMELEEDDRAAFLEDAGMETMASGRIIRFCYETFGLRSFFTYAHNEVRAWTVAAGTPARSAAGKIHTDMERGFIRAEVVAFDDLMACGSVKAARSQGKVRMEGKDYEVRDGDVITFHFSR